MITGRLELLRRHLATPEQQARFDQALVAAKRIAEVIAHMGQITRLETQPGTEVSPMLDLRRSGTAPDPASLPKKSLGDRLQAYGNPEE